MNFWTKQMPNHPSTINSKGAEQFGDAAVLETPKKTLFSNWPLNTQLLLS